MSQENIEIANLVNAAFNRGEVAAALEVFAPDAELLDLQNAPDRPAAIQGIDEIRDAVNLWIGAFDELHAHVQEWIDAADAVVGAVHWHGQAKATGISVDSHQFDVYEFSDGKIVRAILGYRSRDEALESAGLSE
jgi:ketosteroid isomerase-like protein